MDETIIAGLFLGQMIPATNYLLAIMNQVAALFTVSFTLSESIVLNANQFEIDSAKPFFFF